MWTINSIQSLGTISILVAIFNGCKARPQSDRGSALQGESQESCGRDFSAASDQPTYFGIKDQITAHPELYKTRESVIQNLLPESYRRYFVLAYFTKSVQTAKTSPRIIFYGDPKTPNLVIGVAGHGEKMTGANRQLDIIEYSTNERKFCFRSIEFSSTGAVTTTDHAEADCQGCHSQGGSQDGRPIWEPYNTWPGVFGSRDGAMAVGSTEYTKYLQFNESYRKKGVFNSLVGPDDLSAKRNDLLVDFRNDPGSGDMINPLPAFTDSLNNLNFARISKLIQASPRHSSYKFAILGAFVGCKGIPDFLPAKFVANHPQTMDDIITDTKSKLVAAQNSRESTVNSLNYSASDGVSTPNLELKVASWFNALVSLRYLLENRQDGSVGMNNWSLSNINSAYAFGGKTTGITSIGMTYLQDVFPSDQKVDPSQDIYTLANHGEYFDGLNREDDATYLPKIQPLCDILKSQSLNQTIPAN